MKISEEFRSLHGFNSRYLFEAKIRKETKDMLLSAVSQTLIESPTTLIVSTEIEFSQHKSKMHSLNCLRIKFNSLHGIAKRTIDTPQHCE